MMSIQDILDGKVRTDFECKTPGVGMAIRRKKKADGFQWYGLMQFSADPTMYLFDDGRAYRPTEAQMKEAVALVVEWNNDLRKKREM
jgi:hypothetical protein